MAGNFCRTSNDVIALKSDILAKRRTATLCSKFDIYRVYWYPVALPAVRRNGGLNMCAYSASDIDFYTAGSSFHSAVLVSKSRHASVYRCCFASSGSSTQRPCCLKTVRIDGPLLRHQLNLLTRLAAASKAHLSHGSVHEGAEFDVLPLLRFGAIPAYAR